MTRISAAALLLLVFLGVNGAEKPVMVAKGDTLRIGLDPAFATFSAEVRAAVTSNPAHGNASWGMILTDSLGREVVAGRISWGQTGFDDAFDKRYLRLTVTSAAEGESYADFTDDVDLHRGFNTLAVYCAGGVAEFAVGSEILSHSVSVPYSGEIRGIAVSGNRKLKIEYTAVSGAPDPRTELLTDWTVARLTEHFSASSDPLEGYWIFLDRVNNPAWALPGGAYTLAVVADGKGGYDILYVSGAEVNLDDWTAGMLKGKLVPAPFVGHFGLTWRDATMHDAGEECSADFNEADRILTLNFPLHRAIMRFRRLAPSEYPL